MTKEIRALVEEAFDLDEAFDILRNIYLIDRWFTFPKFHESADYAVAMMNEAPQVQAQKLEYPADGKSRFFDWTMPLAWDAKEACLEIIEPKVPDHCLARRMKYPCSLVMWSAPTPPEGIEAEMVYWDGIDEQLRRSLDLSGKIVFTTQDPRELKQLAASKGALGIVSCYMPNPEVVSEGIFWVNGWSDRPGGWAMLADDSRLFGFGISPNRGKELIRLFEESQPIRVRAVVDSKLYEGTLPQVCGFIQGETSEEVLIIGHQFEVGADDNASGCAIIVELARAFGRLIEAGKLPRPRRSIRFITGSECYTTFAYASAYPERMASTIAGLNIDMISIRSREPATFRILATPHANICFCDRLLERIVKETFTRCNISAEVQFRPFEWSDNVLSDPLIDVPTPFLWNCDKRYWHSSYDTPEMVDPEMLRAVGIASGTYLLTLANAGAEEALVLADEMAHVARRVVEESPRERKCYLRDRQKDMIASLSRLVPGNDPELARKLAAIQQELDSLAPPTPQVEAKGEAASIVPKAKCPAPLTFEKIPHEEWKDFPPPRWHTTMASLLQWANGKRTLAEIEQLTIGECGKCDLPVLPLFKFLQKHGYLEFAN